MKQLVNKITIQLFSFQFHLSKLQPTLMHHQHHFHSCPLRSSSLLVVSKPKQTIVTATDDVFTLLGYTPSQLIGHHIAVLGLKQQNQKHLYLARHESQSQIQLEICIHHDPLNTATELEYWLIRPIHAPLFPPVKDKTSHGSLTVLRLSPYGTIENALPSQCLHQSAHDLIGKPIMSFVHAADVQTLCEGLSQTTRQIYHTFRIRWLACDQPKDGHEWMTLTVMTMRRRLSCTSLDDPLTRPICILRPTHLPDPPISSSHTSNISPNVFSAFDALQLALECLLEMPPYIKSMLEGALGQGKSYMVEYAAHVVESLMDMVADCCSQTASKVTEVDLSTVYPTTTTTTKRRTGAVQVILDGHKIETVRLAHTLENSERGCRSRRVAFVKGLRHYANRNFFVQRSLRVLEFTGLVDHRARLLDFLEEAFSGSSNRVSNALA